MDKRRFDLMVLHSMYETEVSDVDWYTPEEFDKGYHFCIDWDYLFIEPNGAEWEGCVCHPLKRKEGSKPLVEAQTGTPHDGK